jgi:DNA relaxase NicK
MDDRMVQFSGSYADRFYERIYRADAHISRIDLRVDVKYTEMPTKTARKGYASALRANNKLPISRRRKMYILMGSDGGDTLYIGSPTSEQRGRLYNKEIQSEDPIYGRTWRYECVYRNDAAAAAIKAIGRGDGERLERIKSIVATWYSQRGVYTGHFAGSQTIALPIARTLPSDVEKRLVWLRSQVAPALKMLREHGALNDALEALDLPSRDEG